MCGTDIPCANNFNGRYKKICMGKGTYQRSTRSRTDVAKEVFRTSVKEEMTKRDANIARAMAALEAAVDNVGASIAALVDTTMPEATAFRAPTISARNRRLPKEFGLVGDINRVAYRLKLLQAAVDRATRRVCSGAPPAVGTLKRR
jgi:predicted NBD/HSP70 family sugar kinase